MKISEVWLLTAYVALVSHFSMFQPEEVAASAEVIVSAGTPATW